MSSPDLGRVLESCGAILQGHFLLTSGRHSALYVEKFRILEQPEVLSAVVVEIVAWVRRQGLSVDLVVGPTTGGIIIAFEVARQLGVPALYVESEGGEKKLRRGATLPPGAKALVVDDVLTTGRSVFEVLDVVRGHQGVPVGVAVLIDRSEAPIDFGAPCFGAHRVEAESFAPDAVPDWLARIPITKPGTRTEKPTNSATLGPSKT